MNINIYKNSTIRETANNILNINTTTDEIKNNKKINCNFLKNQLNNYNNKDENVNKFKLKLNKIIKSNELAPIQEEPKDKNIIKPIQMLNNNNKSLYLNNNSIFNNQEDPKEEDPKEKNSIKLINIDKNHNITVKDINLNNQIEKLHETRLKISEDLNDAYIGLDNISNNNAIKENKENKINTGNEEKDNINIINKDNNILIQNVINNEEQVRIQKKKEQNRRKNNKKKAKDKKNKFYSKMQSQIKTVKNFLENSRVYITHDYANFTKINLCFSKMNNELQLINTMMLKPDVTQSNFNLWQTNILSSINAIGKSFQEMCKLMKKYYPNKYNFIPNDFSNCEESIDRLIETCDNKSLLNNNETLLYKALCYVLCCSKLQFDIMSISESLIKYEGKCNKYLEKLGDQFQEDLAPVF